MQKIDENLLFGVSQQAKKSGRLRMNYNFHRQLDDRVQRLLNALEPGTVVPIHCHMDTDETYLLLSGRLRVDFYSANGVLINSVELDSNKGCYGVNIERGEFHSLEVLASGTVIFEVKEGPYRPLSNEELLLIHE